MRKLFFEQYPEWNILAVLLIAATDKILSSSLVFDINRESAIKSSGIIVCKLTGALVKSRKNTILTGNNNISGEITQNRFFVILKQSDYTGITAFKY